MPATRSEIKAGTVLDGRYRLDHVIGNGTMGTVYHATQLTVNRPVAVKVLNTSLQHHPKLQQRFEIEARAVAALNHPNVLTLFDFAYSMDKDVLYMVVEFIDGDTLSDLIRRGMSPKLALHVAFQITNALAHAHDAGVAHRDLKPGNVMLAHERRGERVKVLDFGLARVRDGVRSKRVTGEGDVQGAPGYMSPEQCVGDMNTGPPADLYALGCIMFEMFEGTLPFDCDGPGQFMQAHMHEPPPTPKNPAVAEPLRALVNQMMNKSPEQRPTAEHLLEALQPYLDVDVSMETLLRRDRIEAAPAPVVVHTVPVETVSAVTPRTTPDRRTPLIAVIVALVLANALTIAYFALT